MSRLVALTGGTGFLGRHVADAFASTGWRLRLLVRRPAEFPFPVETVRGSLGDVPALDALVDGADAVVQLAGAIRARSRAEFMAVNRDGSAAVVDAWRRRGPGARFVLVSSLAAREPGLSHYGASKAAGEAALQPGEAVILRPTVIYGPGDRATLDLFRAARWPAQPILNGPDARIALVHVADVAKAVLAAAAGDIPRGTYEVTDGRPQGYGWREIVGAACRACGRASRPVRVPVALLRLAGRAGDLAALAGLSPMLTTGKAREVLHADWGSRPEAQPPAAAWRPTRDIDGGFAETVAWYRAAGWLPHGSANPPGQGVPTEHR